MRHKGDFEDSFYLVHRHPLGEGGREDGCQGQGQPEKRQEAWTREGASLSCSPISVGVLLDSTVAGLGTFSNAPYSNTG